MTAKPFRLFLAAIVLTAMAVPSFAHHSTAHYDSAKEIVLKGVVTAWLWRNPPRLELTVVLDDPKLYTKTWVGRDKLQFTLMPDGTDLMEMIPSASEAAEYRRIMTEPRK